MTDDQDLTKTLCARAHLRFHYGQLDYLELVAVPKAEALGIIGSRRFGVPFIA